ncbi:hypothetical protein ACROYT_G026844 [Oculina patagonica]
MKGFLLSIFVFSAVLATAYGLKCYVCGGAGDTCEKDNLKSSQEMDCPTGKCMRVWTKKGDATAIAQTCTNQAGCDAAEAVCDKADGDCKVGCCDSDLCNAGSAVSFSMILMAVCSALGLALLK